MHPKAKRTNRGKGAQPIRRLNGCILSATGGQIISSDYPPTTKTTQSKHLNSHSDGISQPKSHAILI
ncbi:hypothetical protein DdX_05580 [Ditylenchus destructor]|uniref:Uncharacterized protein n=1 Tax=Ditylenchus destructor TaxID=166010 RepID=A0AAD4N974_9BILA|nr:hypothetical protein DdX_05580 [Ditylenchus destructor]